MSAADTKDPYSHSHPYQSLMLLGTRVYVHVEPKLLNERAKSWRLVPRADSNLHLLSADQASSGEKQIAPAPHHRRKLCWSLSEDY